MDTDSGTPCGICADALSFKRNYLEWDGIALSAQRSRIATKNFALSFRICSTRPWFAHIFVRVRTRGPFQ